MLSLRCYLSFLRYNPIHRHVLVVGMLSILFDMVIRDSFLFEIVCSQNILIAILIYYFKVILHGRKSGVS